MNDRLFRDRSRLTGTMSTEDKVRMVASIDHDARTPQHVLALALMRMQLIVGDLENPRTEAEALAKLAARLRTELVTVGASARQIVDLQQDILDALRLELDNAQPESRTMLAHDVLYRAYRNNSGLAADLRFELGWARCSRLQFVADERWIDRILNNLAVNAIRHSQGTRIFFGARLQGDDIVFEVRDNGRGMKPEAVARVFEPLAPPTLPGIGRSAASAGLGLYIVRLYAEKMGGSVQCRSAPGRGTCFQVRLPGPVTVNELRPMRADDQASAAVRNKFLAILDDDIELLKSTERLFADLGVLVLAGEEPVRWFNALTEVSRMPDLFLMDFQLRGQDVELTLNMVRWKWGDQNPRIIVVTGHINNPALLRISKSVPVLRKPLNQSKLDLILGVLSGEVELPEAGFI